MNTDDRLQLLLNNNQLQTGNKLQPLLNIQLSFKS